MSMSNRKISRRSFAGTTAGIFAVSGTGILLAHEQEEKSDVADDKKMEKFPEEAVFERDYEPPSFKPKWNNKQINRQMAADFVIFAHSDLKMVEQLYDREPGLLNATLDWGSGDWETALGGASHMGRKDIIEFLLDKGARLDLFCATTLGLLESVKSMLEVQPKLIDAKGPHGFTLHFHAQVGQDDSKDVLDYLQSIKEVDLRPLPKFLMRK